MIDAADVLKWLAVGLVPVMIAIGAMISHCCNFRRHSFHFSLAKVFTGGLLFGFGFLHILSDANEAFDSYASDNGNNFAINDNSYPFVNAIAALAFFAMILIEKLVGNCFQQNTNVASTNSTSCSVIIDQKSIINIDQKSIINIDHNNSIDHNNINSTNNTGCDYQKGVGCSKNCSCGLPLEAFNSPAALSGSLSSKSDSPTSLGFAVPDFSVYILTFALCIHSFFEGLAIGLETEVANVLVLLIGIIVHKGFESFSIGVVFSSSNNDDKNNNDNNTNDNNAIKSKNQRLKKNQRRRKIIVFLIFSLITPLGIIVGIFSTQSSDLAEAVMGALASGVLLYTSIMCMLDGEFNNDNNNNNNNNANSNNGIADKNKKLFLKIFLVLLSCLGVGFLSLLG